MIRRPGTTSFVSPTRAPPENCSRPGRVSSGVVARSDGPVGHGWRSDPRDPVLGGRCDRANTQGKVRLNKSKEDCSFSARPCGCAVFSWSAPSAIVRWPDGQGVPPKERSGERYGDRTGGGSTPPQWECATVGDPVRPGSGSGRGGDVLPGRCRLGLARAWNGSRDLDRRLGRDEREDDRPYDGFVRCQRRRRLQYGRDLGSHDQCHGRILGRDRGHQPGDLRRQSAGRHDLFPITGYCRRGILGFGDLRHHHGDQPGDQPALRMVRRSLFDRKQGLQHREQRWIEFRHRLVRSVGGSLRAGSAHRVAGVELGDPVGHEPGRRPEPGVGPRRPRWRYDLGDHSRRRHQPSCGSGLCGDLQHPLRRLVHPGREQRAAGQPVDHPGQRRRFRNLHAHLHRVQVAGLRRRR